MAKILNSGLTVGLHHVQFVASSKDLFCRMSLIDSTVSNFITANHKWDLSLASIILPYEITQFIQAIPLSYNNSQLLPGPTNMEFSFRYLHSSYRAESWAWIWNLKLSPKIKIFIWQCAHNRIPKRATLFPHLKLQQPILSTLQCLWKPHPHS